MTRALATAAIALVAAAAALSPAAASAAPRPFVYVVVVDGLDGDSVEQGAAPYLSGLLSGEGARATYFPRSRSVLPAETNPNHVAMMTGAFPGRSGVAANAFAIYAPLADENGCAPAGPFDLTAAPTPTSGESPTCPTAETVFEAARRQGGARRPLTAAIMGKPKLGRIFDIPFGGERAVDHLWAPCDDTPEDDAYCAPVATNPVTGYAATDAVVMDEVVRTVAEGVPAGERLRPPDLTFVNLPLVDSAGHAFGRGALYDAAIGLADAELERLVATLTASGRWHRSVVIVVSDHSMETTVRKINLTRVLEDAGVPPDAFRVVGNGSVDFVYAADRTSEQRHQLLSTIRSVAEAEEGVDQALYRRPNPADGNRRHTVRRQRPYWSAGTRTGDLFVTASSGYAFSDPGSLDNPLVGNHGATQTADNFLAVLGGHPAIRQGSSPRRASNVDLAATVSGLLRLHPPRDNQGRALRPAFRRGALD